MYAEFERNMPGHEDWEGSFYERLTEYGEWNLDAFWKLHLDLHRIASAVGSSDSLDRDLATNLLTLQQKVLNLIAAHFHKNDVFRIENVTEEMLSALTERFEFAIIDAVTGEIVPESAFDLVNPLLQDK